MADEVVRAEIIAEDKTGPGIASARRNLSGLQRDLNGGAQGFSGFSAGASGATRAISTFAAGAAGVGAIVGAMALGKLAGGFMDAARGALQSYVEFERLGTSLNALAAKEALLTGQASTMQQALTQTAASSKELLDWIQKLAIESPFRQDDVAQAFRLSMALGFSTKEAQRLTTAMINFATATGAEGYSMERIARALGQINTKGRLSLEEVNQLTEAGVDVMRILADATGKTGKALTDDISKGAVDAKFAIEAILADTERLYSGAAKASATSMGGIISSLQEMGELSSRNFFAGMFKEAQPYLASILGIITAPEFQAGITAWGEKLGNFTADSLQGAADAVERIDAAVAAMQTQNAPPWLTAVAGLAAAGDYDLKINIQPEITTLKTPDGGLTLDITANATKLTTAEGGEYSIDVKAKVISLDANTTDDLPPVKLVANWQEGTIGSLIAAAQTSDDGQQRKILFAAGWNEGVTSALQTALDVAQFTGKVKAVLDGEAQLKLASDIAATLRDTTWPAIQAHFNGEEYKAKWQQMLDSWSPIFKPLAQVNWGEEFSKTRTVNAQLGSFDWGALWTVVRLVNAALGTFDWGGLWDRIYTVNATVKRTYEDVDPYPIYGPQMGVQNTAGSGLGGWDNPGWGDDVRAYYGDAIGEGFFRGGLAMVGEAGPELVVLPRGAQVFSNRDTKALYGGSIPGFAEGTTQIPPGLRSLLSALGLWVPQTPSGAQYGPPTRDEAYGTWRKIEQKGTEAMQGAADKAGNAFESAAKKTSDVFKSVLQGVPGLFGRSQVTADQMRLAEMGVPQNFADDWLRRLNDEVLNGVNWEDTDIQDAARRAGIDPNLPNQVILELVNQAWSNGSFFANPANLDLINMDAVKTSMQQQQKEMQGKQNLLGLFGISDENLQEQIDALGTDIAGIFGGAADSDAVKDAGAVVFGAVMGGFSDSNTATEGVAGMAQSIRTAAGTPENQQLLYDGGMSAYGTWLRGWKAAAGEAAVVPPSGAMPGPSPAPAAAPGKAVGVGYWYGGWMTVHANETIYAPRGTSVRTAGESAERGQTVINNYVTVNRPLDEESLLARLARRVQRGY